MANTYTQIYIHVVFAVHSRQSLIPKAHKEELHKYITGIIGNKNQKLIGGTIVEGLNITHIHMWANQMFFESGDSIPYTGSYFFSTQSSVSS